MNTRTILTLMVAFMMVPTIAMAADPYALNGPPVRDFDDIETYGTSEGGVVTGGTYITVNLLPGSSISTKECVECHPEQNDAQASTPHRADAKKPVECGSCHYVGNAEVSKCPKFVVHPAKLILQRQSMVCSEAKDCHAQQFDELESGKMFDYVSCISCHDVRKMQPDATGHAFGLTKDVENGDELCQPCHSLKAGDSSELSVIHYGFAQMQKGLSAEVADTSNVTPACFDCHQLQDIDAEGNDVKNHNFAFELERSNKSCMLEGCHPDKEYAWVEDQVHRWQDMKANVVYEINEVLFPAPPAVLTVGPVRATFFGGLLLLIAVAAITIVAYQRRDEQ